MNEELVQSSRIYILKKQNSVKRSRELNSSFRYKKQLKKYFILN